MTTGQAKPYRHKPFDGGIALGRDGYVRDHSTGKFAPGNKKGLPKGYVFKKVKQREEARVDFTKDIDKFFHTMLKRCAAQVAHAALWLTPIFYRVADDRAVWRGSFDPVSWPDELKRGLFGMLQHLATYPESLMRAFGHETGEVDRIALMKRAVAAQSAITDYDVKMRQILKTPKAAKVETPVMPKVTPTPPVAAQPKDFRIDAHLWASDAYAPRRRRPLRWSVIDGEYY